MPISPERLAVLPLRILKQLTEQASQFDPKAEFRFVGGCVRDMLLGRKPKDVDVVTNTTPEVLTKMGLENVGKAFPVYLFADSEYGQIEVAVARSEEKTGLGHKGFESIPTGNFQDDVVRRDLNINAMAVDAEGRLHAPEAALEQIESKTFDNVSEKFAEDPLRVFRVARFAAQFGAEWKVSPKLNALMHQMQHELETLPADRVREEFRRALAGKAPINFFKVLMDGGCVEPWFPEIEQNWERLAEVLHYGAGRWDFDQFLVAIGSTMQTPDSLMNRLGISEGIKKAVHYVKANRPKLQSAKQQSKEEVVRLVQMGGRGVLSLEQLLDCALMGQNPESSDYLLACQDAMKQANMEGVKGREDASARLVSAISKIAMATKVKKLMVDAVNEAAEQIAAEPKQPVWKNPQFQKWFGNSVVKNKDGSPKRVMHGSTHEFDKFDMANGNEEGFYGKGFYFTDCQHDVSENYGGFGPDLTSRIEMKVDELLNDDEFMDELLSDEEIAPKITKDTGEVAQGWNDRKTPEGQFLQQLVEKKAKEMIAGQNEGTVYLTYLKMENPVIVTPKGGTYLGGDSGFTNPEDEDEWVDGDEDTAIYEAFYSAAREFDMWKPENIWNMVAEHISDGITAFQLETIIRNSGEITEAGGPGPVISYIYQTLGFDGIIQDASAQFTNMKLKPNTTHYIVWDPRRVKSAIGNIGTFDPENPVMTASITAAAEHDPNENPIERTVEDELENDGVISMDEHRISPRKPSAKKHKNPNMEDPHGDVPLQIDYDSMRNNETFEHNVNLMTQYPNFSDITEGTTHAKAEIIIDRMADNLIYLYKQWAEDMELSKIMNETKEWYVGGNRIIHRWAKRFKLEPWKVAGVIASLSPQQHWFQNLTQAERLLETVVEMRDGEWTAEMDQTATKRGWGKEEVEESAESKQSAKEPKEKKPKVTPRIGVARIKELIQEGLIRTLGDLIDSSVPGREFLVSIWIRAYAEAHIVNGMREVTPSGKFGQQYKERGRVVPLKWTNFGNISKAIRILEAENKHDMSEVFGLNHKVRSFYNNLIAPNSVEGDVTIDTHAVSAALLRPLGGNTTEVSHNFGTTPGKKKKTILQDGKKVKVDDPDSPIVPGTSNSSITGANGLYAIYAEAYRRASARIEQETGGKLLPRELQSITWEAVRCLFTPELKRNKKLIEAANAVWTAHSDNPKDGGIDAATAREQIASEVKKLDPTRFTPGGRLRTPSWGESHHDLYEGPGHSSYEGELHGPSGNRPGGNGRRTRDRNAGWSGGVVSGLLKKAVKVYYDWQDREGIHSALREEQTALWKELDGVRPKLRQIKSTLLAKNAALSLRSWSRNHHHGQTDMTLAAYMGNLLVGFVDYYLYQDRVGIQHVEIGNEVIDKMEQVGIQSKRLKALTDPRERVLKTLFLKLQEQYPGHDLFEAHHAESYPEVEFEDAPSSMAAEFQKLEDMRDKYREMMGILSQPGQDGNPLWNDANDLEYEIDCLRSDLMNYSPTKKVVKSSLLTTEPTQTVGWYGTQNAHYAKLVVQGGTVPPLRDTRRFDFAVQASYGAKRCFVFKMTGGAAVAGYVLPGDRISTTYTEADLARYGKRIL